MGDPSIVDYSRRPEDTAGTKHVYTTAPEKVVCTCSRSQCDSGYCPCVKRKLNCKPECSCYGCKNQLSAKGGKIHSKKQRAFEERQREKFAKIREQEGCNCQQTSGSYKKRCTTDFCRCKREYDGECLPSCHPGKTCKNQSEATKLEARLPKRRCLAWVSFAN